MNINFKKPLITALVLSTASVYYAQKTKDSLEKSKSIDEVVLVGRNLTQVAKERKTPVAVSTIKATEIQERLFAIVTNISKYIMIVVDIIVCPPFNCKAK